MTAQPETAHALFKRHGSVVHREIADQFALIVLCLLLFYSILSLVALRSNKLRTFRSFVQKPVVLNLIWLVLVAYGVLGHFQSGTMQVAKRFGELALACATISTFLALKPALLPRTHQVSFVSLHKWTARTAVAFAYIHSIIYLIHLAQPPTHEESHEESHEASHDESHEESHEASHEETQADSHAAMLYKRHGVQKLSSKFNILGIISFVFLSVLLLTSLRPVRRKLYAFFYLVHWPLALSFFIMMIWHSRPSSYILTLCGIGFMVYNFLFRVAFNKPITVTKVQSFGPSLKLVTFSPPINVNSMAKNLPGRHVRISTPLLNPLTWFKPSHPYTLVGDSQLVTRQTRFVMKSGSPYSLLGPFKSSYVHDPNKQMLIIAGGAGISMLPSFHSSEYNAKLVWITRYEQEIKILPLIGLDHVDVCITSDAHVSSSRKLQAEDEYELQEFEIDVDEDENSIPFNEDEADFDNLLTHNIGPGISKFFGRPDLDKVVEDMENVSVVCCGPVTLIEETQRWARNRGLPFWSEEYGF